MPSPFIIILPITAAGIHPAGGVRVPFCSQADVIIRLPVRLDDEDPHTSYGPVGGPSGRPG